MRRLLIAGLLLALVFGFGVPPAEAATASIYSVIELRGTAHDGAAANFLLVSGERMSRVKRCRLLGTDTDPYREVELLFHARTSRLLLLRLDTSGGKELLGPEHAGRYVLGLYRSTRTPTEINQYHEDSWAGQLRFGKTEVSTDVGTAVVGSATESGIGVEGSSASGIGVLATGSGTALVANASIAGTIAAFRFEGTNQARIDTGGVGYFNGGTQTGGADVAESVVAAQASALEPGDVLVIDPKAPRQFARSAAAESKLVAGVYATKPGVLLRNGDVSEGIPEDEIPLAVVGIVPTKVCDEGGPIAIGDLLVTASKPGRAKKASDEPRAGTVLGKALGALDRGTGTVEVLLMAR